MILKKEREKEKKGRKKGGKKNSRKIKKGEIKKWLSVFFAIQL